GRDSKSVPTCTRYIKHVVHRRKPIKRGKGGTKYTRWCRPKENAPIWARPVATLLLSPAHHLPPRPWRLQKSAALSCS
uniref:Uncharacterized protein n=1 Tax=Aegilops tauschii subsp. strangulata TaxID=200361 RepID=A0A453B0P5_AEGTS